LEIPIPEYLLLRLAHLVDYGLAFNKVNTALDEIHRHHFEKAGGDILDVRDPITDYSEEGVSIRNTIAKLVGVDSPNALFDALRNCDEKGDKTYLVDKEWFIRSTHRAITRYGERSVFWMLENEYDVDLQRILGEQGHLAFKVDVNASLNEHLVCGNADCSIRNLKNKCSALGSPYVKPQAPYLEKHNERFRAMFEAIRASFRNDM
jgi:hypothetical protein